MALLSCPHLGGDVELTEEREQHIRERYPDLLPAYREPAKADARGPRPGAQERPACECPPLLAPV